MHRRGLSVKPLWFCGALLILAGCGAVAPDSPDASLDAMTIKDSGSDQSHFDGACATPNGFAICGDGCPADSRCALCDPKGPAWRCFNDAFAKFWTLEKSGCIACEDGDLCMAQQRGHPESLITCIPHELGYLLWQHDAGLDVPVLYFDRDLFTGDPIPNPTVCPTLPNAQACGGNCGGCGFGQNCIGRSPKHPVGFCADGATAPTCSLGKTACPNGRSCFTFNVGSATQSISDNNGICLAPVVCQSLAQNLPGGGTCTP